MTVGPAPHSIKEHHAEGKIRNETDIQQILKKHSLKCFCNLLHSLYSSYMHSDKRSESERYNETNDDYLGFDSASLFLLLAVLHAGRLIAFTSLF